MSDVNCAEERMALRDVILEATHSLAHLDATRLEELAALCRLLNLQFEQGVERLGFAEAVQGKDAICGLGKLVELTGENLRVLRLRTRDRRCGTDYGQHLAPAWMYREEQRGDH